MFLLVPAHPGCPGQFSQSHKTVVLCVCEVVTMAVNAWIEERHQNFVLEGVKTLEQRWEICVALQGNYVEKH